MAPIRQGKRLCNLTGRWRILLVTVHIVASTVMGSSRRREDGTTIPWTLVQLKIKKENENKN
jgi:hypothetical protein